MADMSLFVRGGYRFGVYQSEGATQAKSRKPLARAEAPVDSL